MKKNDFFYQLMHDKFDTLSSFRFELPADASNPCYGAPLHFHRAIEMIYVTKGLVKGIVGNNEIIAQKDDILFIPPYHLHSYWVMTNSSYSALVLSDKMCEDFRQYFPNTVFPIKLGNKEFNRSILPIWNSLTEEKTNNDLVKKGFANIILGKFSEYYQMNATKKIVNTNMVAQALSYVEEHFTEPLTIDSVANALGYNKYYFSRNFNSCVGENFNSYVNMLRIRQVINQLKKEPNASVTDIIFNAGFNSITTFYRTYKKFYCDSPKKLLKMIDDAKTNGENKQDIK